MTLQTVPQGKRGKPQKLQHEHPRITPEIIEGHLWYALRVAPQCEFKSQDMLADMGLVSFIPTRMEYRHRNKYDRAKRRKIEKFYPILVGYCLVGFTLNQLAPGNVPNWVRIFDLAPIKSVVGFDGRPRTVRKDALIEIARRWPNGLTKPDTEAYMRTHCEFGVGDFVRISSGPFEGQVVPVLEIRKARSWVEADLFDTKHRIEVPTYDLEKVA